MIKKILPILLASMAIGCSSASNTNIKAVDSGVQSEKSITPILKVSKKKYNIDMQSTSVMGFGGYSDESAKRKLYDTMLRETQSDLLLDPQYHIESTNYIFYKDKSVTLKATPVVISGYKVEQK